MKPIKKNIHGILLLDKPEGLSSNQAMQKARWLFQALKAGHTGSLDPMATGVLPICFGEATKFSQLGLDANKKYFATLQLGITTNTGDREGEVIAQANVPVITEQMLQEVQHKFMGKIMQVPPMYSALKKDGVPLYRLARQGQEVERAAREVAIYNLAIKKQSDTILTLDVACSKGTYIRTLAEDIGNYLGCGGHLIGLRRTAAGEFSQPLFTLDQLQAMSEQQRMACLLPADALLQHLPKFELDDLSKAKILNGQSIELNETVAFGEVRLYHGESFLGLAEIHADGMLKPKRLVNTQ